MNKLEVNELSHVYQDGNKKSEVLKGVNATFEGGKIYAIVGESGSGKTTLISLMAGLDKVQSGTIKFNTEDLTKIGLSKFRLKYVGVVFQAYNLIKYMNARENVQVALDFKHEKTPHKALEILESVGIDKKKALRLVGKLSGGEQQRVAIARAIASDCPIIVADEPTGNLDEETENIILELFKMMAENGKIVIIVTHSINVAKKTKAIIYNLKSGIIA